MQINQVAAQLYTLRDFLKTPEDVAATLKKVRAIGYEAVQISGMSAPLSEAEIMEMLNGEGLVCCATHDPTDKILDQPEVIIERLQKLNCQYTAVPSAPGSGRETMEGVREFAAKMDAAGAKFQAAGMTLCYHNHDFEFVKLDGKTVLDHFYDLTQPANLQGEIDTYWVQAGGGDSVAWCRKLDGRLPLIHLKDYKVNGPRKPDFAEIGYGNMDFAAIIQAAELSGCKWFIVEQDTTPGDPFDSLKMSFEFLRDHLAS